MCVPLSTHAFALARAPRGVAAWQMTAALRRFPAVFPERPSHPDTPVRVERLVIPEDLRQRVLTAIADELQRDEAEARRRAQEQGKTEKLGIAGEHGTAWCGTR